MIIRINDFKGTVLSLLSLLPYFLWGIKEVYKLPCWTWILADFSFLQHYTPSHEHVAPHESWQMKQLGNYPDAEWEYCYWWKVFSPKIDLWCDSSSFEMYTRAWIDGTICCLLPCTMLFYDWSAYILALLLFIIFFSLFFLPFI